MTIPSNTFSLTDKQIDTWDIEGHYGVWIPFDYGDVTLYSGSRDAEISDTHALNWANQLKAQILENQEKAERMDELYNTGYMAVEKKVWKLERQENKHLKSKYHKLLGDLPNYETNKEIVEKLKTDFIDCDEYPPLTKWFKELTKEPKK